MESCINNEQLPIIYIRTLNYRKKKCYIYICRLNYNLAGIVCVRGDINHVCINENLDNKNKLKAIHFLIKNIFKKSKSNYIRITLN